MIKTPDSEYKKHYKKMLENEIDTHGGRHLWAYAMGVIDSILRSDYYTPAQKVKRAIAVNDALDELKIGGL